MNGATLEARMFPVFDQIMLARNSASKIMDEDGEEASCGATIAELHIVRGVVNFNPDEQISHDAKIQHLAAFRDEQKRLREEEKRQAKKDGADDDFIRELTKKSRYKPGSRFHQELLVSTYQAASGLVHIPAGVFQSYYKGPLALLDALKESGGVAPKYATAPHDTPEKMLLHLLDGSPIFRRALKRIGEIVRHAQEGAKDKVMVMCLSPKTAHIFYTIVPFMGIESVCLTAQQSQDERSDIIYNFNEEDNVKVLVATYGLDLAGFNCHHRCARVILLEPAVNGSQEAQAYMRVHRIGQKEKQAVMRFHQANSWMDKWDKKLTRKQDRDCAMMLQYLHSRELQQSGDIGIKSASASMVSGYMSSLLDDSDEETDYGDDLPGLLSEGIAELEEARARGTIVGWRAAHPVTHLHPISSLISLTSSPVEHLKRFTQPTSKRSECSRGATPRQEWSEDLQDCCIDVRVAVDPLAPSPAAAMSDGEDVDQSMRDEAADFVKMIENSAANTTEWWKRGEELMDLEVARTRINILVRRNSKKDAEIERLQAENDELKREVERLRAGVPQTPPNSQTAVVLPTGVRLTLGTNADGSAIEWAPAVSITRRLHHTQSPSHAVSITRSLHHTQSPSHAVSVTRHPLHAPRYHHARRHHHSPLSSRAVSTTYDTPRQDFHWRYPERTRQTYLMSDAVRNDRRARAAFNHTGHDGVQDHTPPNSQTAVVLPTGARFITGLNGDGSAIEWAPAALPSTLRPLAEKAPVVMTVKGKQKKLFAAIARKADSPAKCVFVGSRNATSAYRSKVSPLLFACQSCAKRTSA
ncbi:hypothetical protein BDY17DRAFT_312264 [Neohortaea acidophila]|uniref:Helicase C-terminal domain-containing protein n=1 Tax=Neohortaea acidophila TaxID=245834 RepID=A0A6A6PPG4_9PEZI|nr:uncharacterized protein BDY17DRAFT_312264 [Neohortaea acidophila]KAF2481571.1 hypothetical protein BDY17DRAFT_312264 [Neohortaea acidophila]